MSTEEKILVKLTTTGDSTSLEVAHGIRGIFKELFCSAEEVTKVSEPKVNEDNK